MPLPQIPDALSKGTINGCVIPWEVVPSVKVHELTKYHAEFDPAGGALYTTTFVMCMNKAKYNSLPPDLKKIIDANSGMATSGWLGKVQQAGDVAGRKSASDRGNTIFTVSAAEAQEFRRRSRQIEVEWVEDMDKRGFDGRKLLETARSLIDKHTKSDRRPEALRCRKGSFGSCFGPLHLPACLSAAPSSIAATAAPPSSTASRTTATRASARSARPATPSTTRTR